MWIDAYLRRRNLSNRAAFSLAKILELILKNSATYIEVSNVLADNLVICWLRTMHDFEEQCQTDFRATVVCRYFL